MKFIRKNGKVIPIVDVPAGARAKKHGKAWAKAGALTGGVVSIGGALQMRSVRPLIAFSAIGGLVGGVGGALYGWLSKNPISNPRQFGVPHLKKKSLGLMTSDYGWLPRRKGT